MARVFMFTRTRQRTFPLRVRLSLYEVFWGPEMVSRFAFVGLQLTRIKFFLYTSTVCKKEGRFRHHCILTYLSDQMLRDEILHSTAKTSMLAEWSSRQDLLGCQTMSCRGVCKQYNHPNTNAHTNDIAIIYGSYDTNRMLQKCCQLDDCAALLEFC